VKRSGQGKKKGKKRERQTCSPPFSTYNRGRRGLQKTSWKGKEKDRQCPLRDLSRNRPTKERKKPYQKKKKEA